MSFIRLLKHGRWLAVSCLGHFPVSGVRHFQNHSSHDLCRPVRWTTHCSGGCDKGREVWADDSSCKELVQIREGDQALDPMQREGQLSEKQIGDNIPRQDKIMFLLDLFSGLKDSKEAVYGALDAWVAWERDFPLPALRRALTMLEKEEQWHRIVQVIKWMLSKGQGTTVGTYEQLIRALEKDYRAEEAHTIWVRKFGYDLRSARSAPWHVCELMISIYYRNNMLERLVKLFEGLEMFNRRPPNKAVVQKVADAYEMLGLLEGKSRVMEKYEYLFEGSCSKHSSKSQRASRKKQKAVSCNLLDPNDGGKLDNRQSSSLASVEAISNAETSSS